MPARDERHDTAGRRAARRGTARRARRDAATQPDAAIEEGAADRPAEISARTYIEHLRAAGETGGIAAFPPPGTRPPTPGVIVPDDYVLPEGFARHYQTTDDGESLAPILVMAPDYELVDADGEPIDLIEGHVVPPEHAPADLPVELLEVPAAR